MKDIFIKKIIQNEKKRQKKQINLIASENTVSKNVLNALGSELVNKYSEGYPGKRYYEGNKYIDDLERETQKRALELFRLNESLWSVNVQALSGSTANFAIYAAIVPLGEKIMSMELSSGGHLSQGQAVSFSGKVWKQIPYSVNEKTELLDYNSIEIIARKEKPVIITVGFSSYSRDIDYQKMKYISESVGALLHVDMSHTAGIIASGCMNNPFLYADIVMTTTQKTLRGPRSAIIFSKIDGREIHKKINKSIFPGLLGGPHNNQIAGVAVALKEANTDKFKAYIQQCLNNAQVFCEEFKKLGWEIVSGGTDNHLFVLKTLDSQFKMTGKQVSEILKDHDIIVNMNIIPFDRGKPLSPSGIRIGVPFQTSKGWKEEKFRALARKIHSLLKK